VLLQLANFGKESNPEPIIAKVSQETRFCGMEGHNAARGGEEAPSPKMRKRYWGGTGTSRPKGTPRTGLYQISNGAADEVTIVEIPKPTSGAIWCSTFSRVSKALTCR
jgi:hypothetical protein